MKPPHFIFAVYFSLMSIAAAADIVTTKGAVYRDVKVTRTDADGISVIHSNGAAFIDFDELPSRLQSEYGWTAEKSAARNAARRADEEKRIAEAKAGAAAMEERQRQEERKRLDAMTAAVTARQEAQRAQAEREAELRSKVKSKETMEAVARVGLVVAGLIVYFLPTYAGRKKRNASAIAILNLLAGWTFVGWVIAMVWACAKDPLQPQVVVIPQPRPVQPRAARPVAVQVPPAKPQANNTPQSPT